MFSFIKKALIQARVEDTVLYEYVLEEIELGKIVKGLWAKAMAASEGDEKKVQSLYMQYRAQSIRDALVLTKLEYQELSKEDIFDKITLSSESSIDEESESNEEIIKNQLNYLSTKSFNSGVKYLQDFYRSKGYTKLLLLEKSGKSQKIKLQHESKNYSYIIYTWPNKIQYNNMILSDSNKAYTNLCTL